MKEPTRKDERLSAFLEGRLQGKEREEFLAQVTASDDDFEVMTDTAEILMAMEEEDAHASSEPREGVIPLRRPERGRRMTRRWPLVLAASIATLALASTLTLRTRALAGAQPMQLAARADTARMGLPAEWKETNPWTPLRGGGPAAEGADDVRAGVLLANLAFAVRAADTAEIQALASRLSETYDPGAGPGTPLKRMAARPDTAPDSLNALLEQATVRLARDLGRKRVEFGAWAQAARVAARYENEAFFRDRATAAMLRRAERMAGGNANVRAAVDGVDGALPAGEAPRWGPLRVRLDALLAELAN